MILCEFFQTGVSFWPIVQSINFSLVPYKHRTKVMGCASFVWSMFLCYEKESSKVQVDNTQLLILYSILHSKLNINYDIK